VTTTRGDLVGTKLKNLKLRLITTPNLPLDVILQNLPNLETLDASWTDLQRLPTNMGYPAKLKKLSLMSVPIRPADLPPFLSHFKGLVILHIGAIGGSDFPSLSNVDLDQLTDVLKSLTELQTVSLARNRKLGGLGGSQRELARFVRLVGRRCQA
jgi:Leucine-rich repeat (LRR) protein